MSTYTKITDFAAKDALLTGNPSKIVKGTEIGAEFDSIAVADASNVKGPTVSVTDNAVVRWDTTTGRITQGSSVTVDDSGNISGTSFTGAHNGTVGATTPSTGAFTTLSASGNISSTNAVASTINYSGSTAGTYIYGIGRNGANGLAFDSYDAITFTTNSTSGALTGTEKMRLDQSGNLLVGATATSVTNGGFALQPASGGSAINIGHITGTASGSSYTQFLYNGAAIGTVTQSGTTAVLYNTTSDYRLKTVIAPVSGSGSRIDALNPVEYEWKADGTRTRGFLAHEFQAVYAQSVNGTKDAVDADGNPVYQSMQAGSSEVIADLVAEIKSLRARLSAAGL